MTHEVGESQKDQVFIKAHDVLVHQDSEHATFNAAKRQRFLAMLKNQYGYDNDRAVDELTRLLKQFYQINRGFAFQHARIESNPKHRR